MSRRKPKRKSTKNPVPPLSGRKLWRFRLMALIGVPLLCFGLLELGLRLAGYGYPTAFLLKSSNHGENTFVQNDQFSWRFFGPRAARQPAATSIPREKQAETVRIFVFGESAAYGDPQPRFGLPRMLEAMLELRHPGKKFEVINAAMTGINSHVIRPLARDCAEARGDVWVIYMGNNEVVGPFGAGTVFGSQTMPLPLIRAGLALKATRTGQLFDALRGAAQKTTADSGEWEGMRAFVKYKVAGSDPRLAGVYKNFGQNLKDIIAAGRNSGAKIVLSTVAVDLKDCAPFASLHRPGLLESQLNEWQRLFDAGVKAQQSGNFRQAATDYDQAEQIDESYAELRFRRGQCALALNDAGAAQKEFAAARNLDALRFRCDSRLNEIIRQQAAGDVALADGERALAETSPDGIPGGELFYEHVHLTFPGNYVLARAIAEKVEKTLMLPESGPWPDIAQCAQRLGQTPRDTQLALSILFGRLGDVPFTFQANHDEQMRRLTEAARKLPPADSAASLRGAQSATEAALARWPNDAELWEQLGEIKAREGDSAGAVAAVQHALDQVPSSGECWLLYGTLLAQEGKYEDAAAAFKRVFALNPGAVWGRLNLASCLEKLGRRDEALVEFKRVVALKPDYGTAWLKLGQVYEKMGRTNDAEQCYNTALTNRVNQVDDLTALARFCFSRRWFGPAVTNYAAAIELSPSDPGLRMEAGQALVAFGRHDEAARQYQVATELVPDQAQPHMQLGFELGRLRQPALAEQEFRQALRLDPNLIDARIDLGVALYEQEKLDDALKQFEDVLQRNPNDATSLRYVQLLRNRTPLPAGR
jgi:tetratricopeptide (TPR) repeat protein